MSFESILWALSQPVSGTPKIILVGLAFHANGSNQAWPGVERLATYARVNHRNTQQALRVLVLKKYILRDINCGGSAGMPLHSRPNLYTLNIEENRALDEKGEPAVGNDAPCRHRHHAPAGSDTPLLLLATPKQPIEPTIEPLINNIKKQVRSLSKPTGVDEVIWNDWILIRKIKRAPPLTVTLLNNIEREAQLVCCSLNDALRICCEHNWANFEANWIISKPKTAALVESFQERNARSDRERWEQLTGIVHPKNSGMVTESQSKPKFSINHLELL